VVNPFNAVSREQHDGLATCFLLLVGMVQDAGREAMSLRGEVAREIKNGENLTALCARAVRSTEILEQALIERQIGKQRDPSLVLVVNSLPEVAKRRTGFMPLNKRRREAVKRSEAESVRRNALPKLTAELPTLPLTKADREAMREAITELSKETT
jgi:hypothetical protein